MDGKKRVGLCVTCLVDQLMPEVGVATVKLLRRAGYEVDFPAEQTCCGQPFYNSGFRAQAANLARRTVEIFEPYEAVVLPSGSCTGMIRLEYPHLLAGEPDWAGRAQRLGAKTFELSEFLVHQAGWRPEPGDGGESGTIAPPASPVTYHDSCHMKRMLGLSDEPRQLLVAAGCSLHEMQEPDRCCGFGGVFSIRMPEVSNAMTAEKLRQAAGSGATKNGRTTLVTADPGCLMQMRGLAGEDVSIQHLAVILEEQSR